MKRLLAFVVGLVIFVLVAFGVSWLIYMPDRNERGVWISPATGNIIDLGMVQAKLYNQTRAGCTYSESFPAHMGLVKAMVGASIDAQGDTLRLNLDSSFDKPSFERADALPQACTAAPDPSAHAVFETMWAAMDENYAFFNLYGVDWDARRALSPASADQLSDTELFEVMKQALAGLDDGHIQLIAGELGYFSPSLAPAWMPEPELERTKLNEIALANIGATLTRSDLAPMRFGVRPDGIGYIQIAGMWANEGFGQSGIAVSQKAFAQVATAMANATGLIIDVRYNPGGNDGTALAYAGFFSPNERAAFYKRTRSGEGWVDRADAVITPAPSGAQLGQPVVLLTSNLTGSGAEIFTMALRDLPQVTVMGEATGGGLSDIHGITLPNGWLFGLSNQEYRTPDDTLYEGVGLPPDIDVATDGAALVQGQDPVLQAAIAHLNGL